MEVDESKMITPSLESTQPTQQQTTEQSEDEGLTKRANLDPDGCDEEESELLLGDELSTVPDGGSVMTDSGHINSTTTDDQTNPEQGGICGGCGEPVWINQGRCKIQDDQYYHEKCLPALAVAPHASGNVEADNAENAEKNGGNFRNFEEPVEEEAQVEENPHDANGFNPLTLASVDSMKVVNLRAILKELNLPQKGKKIQLQNRIKRAIHHNQSCDSPKQLEFSDYAPHCPQESNIIEKQFRTMIQGITTVFECVFPTASGAAKKPNPYPQRKSRIGHTYFMPKMLPFGPNCWGTTQNMVYYHTAVHFTNDDGIERIESKLCFTVGQIFEVHADLAKCRKARYSSIRHVLLAVGMQQADGSQSPRDKDIHLLLAPYEMIQSEEAMHNPWELQINYDEFIRNKVKLDNLASTFSCVPPTEMELVIRLFHIVIQRKRGTTLVPDSRVTETEKSYSQELKHAKAELKAAENANNDLRHQHDRKHKADKKKMDRLQARLNEKRKDDGQSDKRTTKKRKDENSQLRNQIKDLEDEVKRLKASRQDKTEQIDLLKAQVAQQKDQITQQQSVITTLNQQMVTLSNMNGQKTQELQNLTQLLANKFLQGSATNMN